MGNVAACDSCCHDINKVKAIDIARHDPPDIACQSPCTDTQVQDGQKSQRSSQKANGSQSSFKERLDDCPQSCKDNSEMYPKGSQRSSSELTRSTAASSTPDPGTAQLMVKQFVRSFVKGQQVKVLVPSGEVTACIAQLDRKLTTFSIQRAGCEGAKKRHIPLEEITEVLVGSDGEGEVALPLTESCITFLLESGQGIAFHFDDIEDRDAFALCLSMFVDGRRGEMARRAAERDN